MEGGVRYRVSRGRYPSATKDLLRSTYRYDGVVVGEGLTGKRRLHEGRRGSARLWNWQHTRNQWDARFGPK